MATTTGMNGSESITVRVAYLYGARELFQRVVRIQAREEKEGKKVEKTCAATEFLSAIF